MIGTPVFPFIVGCGRSGTTLLRAMFDAHPQMAIPGESYFIPHVAVHHRRFERSDGVDIERFLTTVAATPWFERTGMAVSDVRSRLEADPPATVTDAIRSLYATYAHTNSKTRYADKTPTYVLCIGGLARMFPEARFVHIIRDGRDVAMAVLEGAFSPTRLGDAAVYWRERVARGMRHGARLGPERYREVRYEALVDDPEAVLRDLCAFIELPYDPVMLDYHRRAEQVAAADGSPAHYRNIAYPVTSGLRDWRSQMLHADVRLFEAVAGSLLDELGYERASSRTPATVRIRTGAWWVGRQARLTPGRIAKLTGRTRRISVDYAE